MKKIISVLCVLSLAFCLTACGDNEDVKTTPTKSPSIASPTVSATEEATATPEKTPETTTPAGSTEEVSPSPSGEGQLKNVALYCPLEQMASSDYTSVSWNLDFLTDGYKLLDDPDVDEGTNGWMSDASAEVTDETWFYVDLEDEYLVKAVALYPRGNGQWFPEAYDIQVSTDADEWITVHSVTDDDGDTDTDRMFEITPTNASYVRILIKERYSGGSVPNGYIVEISEIEVYA